MEHEGRLKAALSDRYAVEREIGSGGMDMAYLALDLNHERGVYMFAYMLGGLILPN